LDYRIFLEGSKWHWECNPTETNAFDHWIGLRENPQESRSKKPAKYGVVSTVNLPYNFDRKRYGMGIKCFPIKYGFVSKIRDTSIYWSSHWIFGGR
jgi:hypothetical protein